MEHHEELKTTNYIKTTLKRTQVSHMKQSSLRKGNGLFCGSKLQAPIQKPSHLILGYNLFAGRGCLNYTRVQTLPSHYSITEEWRLEGTSGDNLVQTSCSKPGSTRRGCSGPRPGVFCVISKDKEIPQPLWATRARVWPPSQLQINK